MPSLSSFLPTEKPGESLGTMNALMPEEQAPPATHPQTDRQTGVSWAMSVFLPCLGLPCPPAPPAAHPCA